MPADPTIIVDAHQDIAWNAVEFNRDFLHSAYHKRQVEAQSSEPPRNGLATSGLPDCVRGRVGIIFGTIYTAPQWAVLDERDRGYQTAAEAYQQGMEQLDVYFRLADNTDRIVLIRTQADLQKVLDSWQPGVQIDRHKVGIVLLMEGGDPIREPKAFEEWYERGLRICGPAWTETRYTGGTSRFGRGSGPLTGLGRELLEVMQSFNAVLDVSHMSEAAFLESMDRYSGQIIASHSNPRRFRDSDRQLTDLMIRRLVEHDGVIGAVPFNSFLVNGYKYTDPKTDFSLSHYIGVIDHICQIAGSARHVGIGSDYDGGFGAAQIPAELDTIADLQLVGTALAQRGYSPEDIHAIFCGNFLRVLRATLPR